MSFGRTAWTAVSVASIVVTVFTLYKIFAGSWLLFDGQIGPSSGDDDQIVVSGGSLDIDSLVGFKKHDGDSYRADHLHTKRRLNAIDIRYGMDASQSASIDTRGIAGPISVAFNYCQDMPCTNASPQEQVVFNVDGGHNNLFISNQGGRYGIGDEGDGKSSIHHMPDTWHVTRIDVAPLSQSYQCYGGICRAELHYYCNSTGHCQ